MGFWYMNMFCIVQFIMGIIHKFSAFFVGLKIHRRQKEYEIMHGQENEGSWGFSIGFVYSFCFHSFSVVRHCYYAKLDHSSRKTTSSMRFGWLWPSMTIGQTFLFLIFQGQLQLCYANCIPQSLGTRQTVVHWFHKIRECWK